MDFLIRLIRPTQFYWLALIPSCCVVTWVSFLCRNPAKETGWELLLCRQTAAEMGREQGCRQEVVWEKGGHKEASVKLFQGRETTEPESQQGAEGEKIAFL